MYPRSAYPSDVFLSKIIFLSGSPPPLPISSTLFLSLSPLFLSLRSQFRSLAHKHPSASLSSRGSYVVKLCDCMKKRRDFASASACRPPLCGWKILVFNLSVFCYLGKSDSACPPPPTPTETALAVSSDKFSFSPSCEISETGLPRTIASVLQARPVDKSLLPPPLPPSFCLTRDLAIHSVASSPRPTRLPFPLRSLIASPRLIRFLGM